MKNRIVGFGMVLCLLLAGPAFAQLPPGTDAASLLQDLGSASSAKRVYAAKIISRAGLTDEALYEKVATLLKNSYATASSPDQIDEMAWLCKALAASGNSAYRPLLDEVAQNTTNGKLKNYARQSSAMIEEFAKRNAALNSTEKWDDSLSAGDNRLLNMLNAESPKLRRDAAKNLVRYPGSDIKVFDAAALALQQMAESNKTDNLSVDAMAWLCRALAASGQHKYLETLKQVEKTTKNPKVQKYAKQAYGALQ